MGDKYRTFDKLMKIYGSAENIFNEANGNKPSFPKFINEHTKKEMQRAARDEFIDKYEAIMEKKKIGITTLISEDYPFLLKEINMPPRVLFYIGNLIEPKLPIAVVGTRSCTDYGEKVSGKLGFELASSGVCVISGMALGIDASAARGALRAENNDFPTVAVLGSGLNIIYPKENEKLFYEIAERGLVISEYTLGVKPMPGNFPMRNRVIVGLSKGVVIVEAPQKSGALISAGLALDYNRDLFCVPGRITDHMSIGVNKLMVEGAGKPINSVSDILLEYNIKVKASKTTIRYNERGLPKEALAICKELEKENKTYDDLCEILGLSHLDLNSALTYLEFSGIIKQLPGREYCFV